MRGGSYGHLGVAYPPLMPPPGAMMVPYRHLPQQQQQASSKQAAKEGVEAEAGMVMVPWMSC